MLRPNLTTAQYRTAGKQLLGTELWIGINLTGGMFLCFLMTMLILSFWEVHLISLISLNVLVFFVTIQYVTMPLWGRLKLYQMQKEFGEEKVAEFIDWLDGDDDSTFEFK